MTHKQISKTWVTGNSSATMVISKDIAKKYGLDTPSHVIVEETDKGILIRKINLDDLRTQEVVTTK